MSKVVKGVKKAFKRVVKTVKKVAPIVLAAAAVYFTAGAALGATAGWTGVAGSMGTAMGGSGVLGGVLSGAITQAGYGALAGGAIAELSGGDFKEGAKMGAATGAVTGGVTGGLGAASRGAQATQQGAGAATNTPQVGPEQQATVGPANPAGPGGGGGGAVPGGGGGAVPPGGGGGSGGLLTKGGWLERNQEFAGHVLSGVGQGLMSTAEADAEKDLLRERYRQVRKNYEGADPATGFRGLAGGTSGQSPTERFDPLTYGRFEYAFNPQTGRIERVRVQDA